QGLVGGVQLPKDLLREIVNHADGVPLFVEELTKSILESNNLTQDGEHYVLTQPLPAFSIPSTLHASLLARLDRLGPVKRVAHVGAVIGREFTYVLTSAVAGMPEADLQTGVKRLVAAGLVYPRGLPPEATYIFKHALLRDA